MDRLSMTDMNSLNAIAGSLRGTDKADLSEVLLGIQKKATDLLEQIDTVVDIIYELLDEFDIGLLEDTSYISLADVWCEAMKADPSEGAVKARLKAFLTFKKN